MTLTVLLSLSVSGSIPEDAQALSAKPNIVFILTDDMRNDDLKYMPKTRSVLRAEGHELFRTPSSPTHFAVPAGPPSCAASMPTTPGYGPTKNVGVSAAGGQAYRNKGNEKGQRGNAPRCGWLQDRPHW